MARGDIILLRDQTPRGPFTRGQIQEGLSRGEFTEDDLAHTPGLKDWLPLADVLHHLDRDVVPPTRPPAGRNLPPLPHASVSVAPPLVAAAKALPPVLPAREERPVPERVEAAFVPPEPQIPPAPMRLRIMAWLIDWAVLFVPIIVLFGFAYFVSLIQGSWEHQDAETLRQERALLWRNFRELVLLVAIGFAWLYAAGLESSRWQGTVGKQWMGLIVTDAAGGRLTFLHASGRHAAKYISALPCFLGFMAALFDSQRRAWHDRLAATRVVRR